MSYLSALPQLRLFSIFPQLLYLNAQGWQPDHFHDDFDNFHDNHDNFLNNYDHFHDGYDHFHDNYDHFHDNHDHFHDNHENYENVMCMLIRYLHDCWSRANTEAWRRGSH